MKKVWLLIVMIIGTGFLILAADTIRSHTLQEEISGQVIRFHVRANDDSEKEQEVKQAVKDAVVSYLQPVMEQMNGITQAKETLELYLPKIERTAESVLAESDAAYDAQVSLREEYFPKKTYGDCTFPAGRYLAVVIELGKAKGHNWWCMIYPGLCFLPESYEVVSKDEKDPEKELQMVLSEEAYEWITDPHSRKIGFKWLQKFLNFTPIQGNIK